jgi:hypothetical protein
LLCIYVAHQRCSGESVSFVCLYMYIVIILISHFTHAFILLCLACLRDVRPLPSYIVSMTYIELCWGLVTNTHSYYITKEHISTYLLCSLVDILCINRPTSFSYSYCKYTYGCFVPLRWTASRLDCLELPIASHPAIFRFFVINKVIVL